jgi:hypothetical protein
MATQPVILSKVVIWRLWNDGYSISPALKKKRENNLISMYLPFPRKKKKENPEIRRKKRAHQNEQKKKNSTLLSMNYVDQVKEKVQDSFYYCA